MTIILPGNKAAQAPTGKISPGHKAGRAPALTIGQDATGIIILREQRAEQGPIGKINLERKADRAPALIGAEAEEEPAGKEADQAQARIAVVKS